MEDGGSPSLKSILYLQSSILDPFAISAPAARTFRPFPSPQESACRSTARLVLGWRVGRCGRSRLSWLELRRGGFPAWVRVPLTPRCTPHRKLYGLSGRFSC